MSAFAGGWGPAVRRRPRPSAFWPTCHFPSCWQGPRYSIPYFVNPKLNYVIQGPKKRWVRTMHSCQPDAPCLPSSPWHLRPNPAVA